MANEKLKWFCKEILEKELNLENFEDKLILQKTGYIAQVMGIGWNYDFGWYVRGVYSSKLTVDLYDPKGKDVKYQPTDEDKEIVQRIKSLKDAFSGMKTYNKGADAYELISTIVFAKEYMHITGEDKIAEFAKNCKPWFEDEHVKKAMKSAEGLN